MAAKRAKVAATLNATAASDVFTQDLEDMEGFGLAGGLASRRSKLVAVVVPQINNNMFVDTIQALSDTLAARGYHMLLCVAGYDRQTEAELVSTLLSRRPDGVVLTGIQHAPLLKKTILNAATPVVEIWDLTPTPLDMLVGFSHEKVGETIGEYVLEKGYQRPGLLWAGDFLGRQQRDVGLRGERALDQVGLQAGEQRRHEDDDGDADPDADDDEQRLHPPLAQKAHGGDPFEGHPGFQCWPLFPVDRSHPAAFAERRAGR